jgi:hypothetical protein
VTQIIGTSVIAGILFTVALLAAVGVAVVLIAMVGPTAFDGGLLVLLTFGLTTSMVAKLLRLF